MRTSKITVRKLAFIFSLTISVNSCFKDPEPEEPFILPRVIRIAAIVPEFVYTNTKAVLLDARSTLLLNGRRTLHFKWSCPEYPANGLPKFYSPDDAVTWLDNLKTGLYKLQLVVNDSAGNTEVAHFNMDVKNDTLSGPPQMNILRDTIIYLPQTSITISGAEVFSVNPIGRDLKFLWSLIQQPAGSPPLQISGKKDVVTNIDGYVPGIYQFRLEATNEIGLSAADTMEVKIMNDTLPGTSILYENLRWELYEDGWEPYYYIMINDTGVFIDRNSSNMQVRVWDQHEQNWSPPDKYGWNVTPDELYIIHYGIGGSIPDPITRAKVTFL